MSATPTTEETIKEGINAICSSFYDTYSKENGITLAKVTEAYMQQIMLAESVGSILGQAGADKNTIDAMHSAIDQFCRYIISVYFSSIVESSGEELTEEKAAGCFESAKTLVDEIREFVISVDPSLADQKA